MTAMAVSERALDIAAKFLVKAEGLRLTVYLDQAGLPTIGYGHRCAADHPPIDERQAGEYLRADMAHAAESLRGLRLTDNQAAALLSFVYNVGRSPFATSTMLRKLREGDMVGAAGQFERWKYRRDGSRMVVSAGLIARRARERALFVKG